MTQFNELGLGAPLLQALAAEHYVTPTPIQMRSIPPILVGRDLCGIAQTGTGKTAAFALPILQRLSVAGSRAQPGSCRALVLSPTRELASQIAESFRTYGRHLKLSSTVVFGGVPSRPQTQALSRGVDILVATPGRLTDHLDAGAVRLDRAEIFVLDEADRMLDMGFIHAIRRILPRLPKSRQNLFFSATMPREIARLADELLRDPVKVAITPVSTTADKVAQRVIFVPTSSKRALLANILRGEEMARTLVFTRTKHGADRVVRHLDSVGIGAAAIHGNKSQKQREHALDGFKSGRNRVLIATDIAARGIDIDSITHVVNFDLPNVPETYVHRIGRTARAGAAGVAISFCDSEEKTYLRDIEKLIRRPLPASGSLEMSVAQNAPSRAAPRHDRGRPQNGASRNHFREATVRNEAAGSQSQARQGGPRQGQGSSRAGTLPERDAVAHRRGRDGAAKRWHFRPR